MKKIIIPYPERECPATGKKFVPKRENHVYINRAVQVKHNNEQAKTKRKDLKELNDKIKSNRKKINKLYDYMEKNNWKHIHVEYVKFEEVDLHAYSKTSNNTITGGRICWSLDYGIEALDETMTYYYIHKK